MNLKEKVSRILDQAAPGPTNRGRPRRARRLPRASGQLARSVGGMVSQNHLGTHLRIRARTEGHGYNPDGSIPKPSLRTLDLLSPGVPPSLQDPRRWLMLDTETTGLAGGTGTYAFLVGVAHWDEDGIRVDQFFMRDPAEEPSLLLGLAELIRARPVLVTFNGKSFDWPLLETRFRIARLTPPPLRVHLDFLHPARHIWRRSMDSVTLTRLEREVLGIERDGDVPSSQIPRIYFEFLRGGHASGIVDVLEHNSMDLVGLACLAERVISILNEPERNTSSGTELYGISRLLRCRGDLTSARTIGEKALAAGLPPRLDSPARMEIADLARRHRRYERATTLWEDVLARSPETLVAYEQLAIHYEHRAREPVRAAGLTEEALGALEKARAERRIDDFDYRRMSSRLNHRLGRLNRKLESSSPERPKSRMTGR